MNKKRSWVKITGDNDVARAVVETGRFARELGFDENTCYMISTAISELARNIIKYAGQGDIVINALTDQNKNGIEITVRDQGPGIENIDQALADHYSSSGTLGLGLPGVKRLMDEFSIQSAPGKGTTIVVKKWNRV